MRRRNGTLGRVPDDLPPPVREAAQGYLDSFDDPGPVEELIQSFGDLRPGGEPHRQCGCLLLNALIPNAPCWEHLCDDREPMETHRRLLAWMTDPSRRVDWDSAERPAVGKRDGQVIAGRDVCRVRPIAAAVADCARFLRAGGVQPAVDTLSACDSAYQEGCWPAEETRAFPRWLVETALPAACRNRLLVPED